MAAQEEAGAVLKAALGVPQALGERGEASLAGIYQTALGFLPNPLHSILHAFHRARDGWWGINSSSPKSCLLGKPLSS